LLDVFLLEDLDELEGKKLLLTVSVQILKIQGQVILPEISADRH